MGENGFHRMKEEGEIFKKLPQRDEVVIFQSLVMIFPRF